MPPQRTIPPAKAVKTERTHEENQERAYIAASRRSDRSLEARVESARRASEIHKRRTGRSLRVTEQDVINEEMYEEEDDDLPLQYRRLTAHLQTNSADFNRRLAAYLTNQVAIRTAIDQMVTQSYAQQFPGAPQFAHNQATSFPSPMNNTQMLPPSPSIYRTAPYPSAGAGGRPHHRSQSFATANEHSHGTIESPGQQHPGLDRRLSMPAASVSPGASRSSHSATPSIKQEQDSTPTSDPSSSTSYQTSWTDNFNPFTTSLPAESQQLLGGVLDQSDPFHSMLMQGSEPFIQNPYYPWTPGQGQSQSSKAEAEASSSWNNMSATLAPSALNTDNSTLSTTNEKLKTATDTNPPSLGLELSFDSSNLKGINAATSLSRGNSFQGFDSGQVTPGDKLWDDFINDGDNWVDDSTA